MSNKPYCNYPDCHCPIDKGTVCFKGYPEVSESKTPLTREELIALCNSSATLQSLLYDLSLMPEEVKERSIDETRMLSVAAHLHSLETALAESRAECERLRELVYVPGVWKCAKCKLELMTSIFAVESASIHADNRPQECPNNCGPMWRITERDQRKEAQALHEKEFLRVQAAEAREREAYERAAKVCDEVANSPSSLWEEHGCWAHAAEHCAAVVRALGKRREG